METKRQRKASALPLPHLPDNIMTLVDKFSGAYLKHWQNEFDTSSPLQGPGIAQVITVNDDSVYCRTAYLLKDGSLFLNISTNWPMSWEVDNLLLPYNTVRRMWPHLGKLKSVSFGARTGYLNVHGLLLTENNELYTINDRLTTPRRVENLREETPVLVACGRGTSATIFTSNAGINYLHRRNDQESVLHTGEATEIIQLPGLPTRKLFAPSL